MQILKMCQTFPSGNTELCSTEYTFSPQFSWPDFLGQSTKFISVCGGCDYSYEIQAFTHFFNLK